MREHFALAPRAPRWVRRIKARLRALARRRHPRQSAEDRLVDEAGEESFPASDPPTWTLGIEHPHPAKH